MDKKEKDGSLGENDKSQSTTEKVTFIIINCHDMGSVICSAERRNGLCRSVYIQYAAKHDRRTCSDTVYFLVG